MGNKSLFKMAASKTSKGQSFVQPIKIKRIIQSNEDIGKMNNSVPLFMAKASENFTNHLIKKLIENNPDIKSFDEKHMISILNEDESISFAKHLVQKYTKVKKVSEKQPKAPKTPKAKK